MDHWHHEALIAFALHPRTPVAVARYVRVHSRFDTAELAIEVIDPWQRRGIGRALALALRDRAVRAGVRRFTASMLPDNEGARALARELGPLNAITIRHGVAEMVIALE